ncbi:uncharacterized protein BJ171DRAFT_473150 [Polychytrium aggregatum]|uniref:uncharacterized protein n=1 Tax=Polychytrium aggregatum TaxID=110093 RepID=UPI0022FEA88E|nr:uncharacterized protein BJ171DRAFT_473150 [Polychytrium aggregatum]KAI9206626.1 hypothetical protein BJ171DRAFT_473150 [Polychytrium aggregatum]
MVYKVTPPSSPSLSDGDSESHDSHLDSLCSSPQSNVHFPQSHTNSSSSFGGYDSKPPSRDCTAGPHSHGGIPKTSHGHPLMTRFHQAKEALSRALGEFMDAAMALGEHPEDILALVDHDSLTDLARLSSTAALAFPKVSLFGAAPTQTDGIEAAVPEPTQDSLGEAVTEQPLPPTPLVSSTIPGSNGARPERKRRSSKHQPHEHTRQLDHMHLLAKENKVLRAQLDIAVEALSRANRRIRTEISLSDARAERYEARISDLEYTLSAAHGELTDMSQRVQKLESQLTSSQEMALTSRHESEQYRAAYGQMETQLRDWKDRERSYIRTLSSELAGAKDTVQQLLQERERWASQQDDLLREYKALKRANQLRVKEVMNLKAMMASKHSHRSMILCGHDNDKDSDSEHGSPSTPAMTCSSPGALSGKSINLYRY